MQKRLVTFGLFLFLLGCLVVGAAVLGNGTGVVALWRAQNAARLAEAEARRIEAEVELTRARADVETAQGQRAVLEAAARSVDADRRLVTWFTLRGDLRAILALVGAVGLALCGGALFVVVKGVQDAKNTHTDN